MKKTLILGDRGYLSLPYSNSIKTAGGHIIIRAQNLGPILSRAFIDRKKPQSSETVRFKGLVKQRTTETLDVDCHWPKHNIRLRVLSLWPLEAPDRINLLTTLPRRDFSARSVADICRLRWQVELLFKEMKSYSGLRRWNTRKKSLVEAVVWASVLTVSLILDRLSKRKPIKRSFLDALRFIREQAARAHPSRDTKQGRFSDGMQKVIS